MDVAFVLLCDRVEVLNGKFYMMGGGWNGIHINKLGSEIEAFAAVGIDIDPQNLDTNHEVKVEVVDPDGKMVQPEFDAHFAFPSDEDRPGQTQRLNVALKIMPTIAVFGPHAVIISINGEELGRARFYVNQLPESF